MADISDVVRAFAELPEVEALYCGHGTVLVVNSSEQYDDLLMDRLIEVEMQFSTHWHFRHVPSVLLGGDLTRTYQLVWRRGGRADGR